MCVHDDNPDSFAAVVTVLCDDVHGHLALPWDAHVPPERGQPVEECANKPRHVCQKVVLRPKRYSQGPKGRGVSNACSQC
jgi:hypothetical protein